MDWEVEKLKELRYVKEEIDSYVAIRNILEKLNPCKYEKCSFFLHYEVWYDAEKCGQRLSHQGFHQAEKECEKWQTKALEFLDRNVEIPDRIREQCKYWENRICA